jgi:hypothetical protein
MDKKDKKAVEDAIKNSLLPGMSQNSSAFLDAASLLGKYFIMKSPGVFFNIVQFSAYYGNGRDSFMPFSGGMPQVNSASLNAFDKNSSSAQQANLNASMCQTVFCYGHLFPRQTLFLRLVCNGANGSTRLFLSFTNVWNGSS